MAFVHAFLRCEGMESANVSVSRMGVSLCHIVDTKRKHMKLGCGISCVVDGLI